MTRRDLALAALAVLLLILLWALRGLAMMVAFAILFAYVLDPAVELIQRVPLWRRRRAARPLAATVVIAAVLGLAAWLASFSIPLLVAQLGQFFAGLPAQIDNLVSNLRVRALIAGWGPGFDSGIEALRANAKSMLPQAAGFLLQWVGGVFARFDQVLALAVLPVLTFYLIVDRRQVRESMLRFLPSDLRNLILSSGPALHRALQSYVRGQALVCLTMGVSTGAMLAIAGVPNAFLLGVLAGLAEILPFLGAFVASLAIVLSGLSIDIWRAVIGISLYTLDNWLLANFVTPRLMSRYLELHPFTVIVSVLAGAQLLGPPGAILALPAAAVIQGLIEDLARRGAVSA